jgi:hypothetical protein
MGRTLSLHPELRGNLQQLQNKKKNRQAEKCKKLRISPGKSDHFFKGQIRTFPEIGASGSREISGPFGSFFFRIRF